MKLVRVLQHWSLGIRLYIAIGIVLFTLESVWWAEISYGGSLLFATRLEELYAWTAVVLLTIAVVIGPLCNAWAAIPGKRLLHDARRLFGIGAAWFSVLHVTISYASLFKFANPLTLPGTYQRAFATGTIASLILLAMAFTSFNKAFQAMGSWWFRLHRLVYGAIVLILVHAFLIGSHATHLPELLILTTVVAITIGLHFYVAFVRRKPASLWQTITMPTVAIVLLATLFFGYSQRLSYDPLLGDHEHQSHGMHNMEMN